MKSQVNYELLEECYGKEQVERFKEGQKKNEWKMPVCVHHPDRKGHAHYEMYSLCLECFQNRDVKEISYIDEMVGSDNDK